MIYPQSVSYAIEALSYLARFSPKTFYKVKDIAKELDIKDGTVRSRIARGREILKAFMEGGT